MTLITTDLDDAMKGLDWSLPQNNGNVLYGRVTKATAKHVRAQVAMWESDWDTAIEECEDIFKQEGIYSMEKKAENVFNGWRWFRNSGCRTSCLYSNHYPNQ